MKCHKCSTKNCIFQMNYLKHFYDIFIVAKMIVYVLNYCALCTACIGDEKNATQRSKMKHIHFNID